MKTLLALYRGESIVEAKIIAVSADPDLISYVAGRLLSQSDPPIDPVLVKLQRGRQGALRALKREAEAERPVADVLRLLRDQRPPQERGDDR
jgi:hypothetical protein